MMTEPPPDSLARGETEAPAPPPPMVRVEDLHFHFGGIRAVDGVSVRIEQGSITGLIGPNGAGKTTLFNVIAGVYPPSEGRVFLQDQDVTGLKPHQLFHKGVLRTFQIAHEFSSLTVLENLMTAPGGQAGESLVNAWFRRGKVRAQEAEISRASLGCRHVSRPATGRRRAGRAPCPAGRRSFSRSAGR